MDLLRAIHLVAFIAILHFSSTDGQVYGGRRYSSFCSRWGRSYYPCHEWIQEKQDEVGNDITRFSDCLTCIERQEGKPYPHHMPRCPKACGPGTRWCDIQGICLSETTPCRCEDRKTYCTYFSAKHNVEKYRCLSEDDHLKLVERGDFQNCLDGTCKHNCYRIGLVSERNTVEDKSDEAALGTLDNVTLSNGFKWEMNTTSVRDSARLPLVLICGGSLGGVLLVLFLLLAVCFIKRKIKIQTKEEIQLQNITSSENINIPKNSETKSILQRVLDYPWKIAQDFGEIEEFASGLERPTKPASDKNVITLSDPAGTPKLTYLNASAIRFEDLEQTFISTQIPTKNSTQHFWRMIIQQNVSVLILLDSRSVFKFWPDKNERLLKFSGESVTVRYLGHSFTGSFYRRKFEVVERGEKKLVDMLHIEGWGDTMVPSTTRPILNVLYETQDITDQRQGQIMTMCSNGADRCGTYIALYKLIEDYKNSQKQRLDVFGTVISLRQQRQRMVGREEQYEFALEGLLDFIIAQEVEYEASGDLERLDTNDGQGSVIQETGCTCRKVFSATWEIATSLWLVGDMALDIQTTRTYHHKMLVDELSPAFFIGSVVAHVAPVLGIVFMSWLYMAYVIRRPARRHYVQTVVFSLLAPIIWPLTPLLALISALFGAMGIDINSDHRVNDSAGRFRRFMTYVMIVKAIEQFMEALPQLIISSVYLDAYGIEDNLITLLSCIASSGSLLCFLCKHVHDIVNNFDMSIVGVIAADRVTFP